MVVPLLFAKGSYLLYIPPGLGFSCNRGSVLFTRFKPENPLRSAFRVEPLGGAGPA